jgi:hypothetical protein
MSISMHAASSPIFVRALSNMLSWLDIAEAHAKERDFDANNYLALRFAPDMLPFTSQVQVASDVAKRCVARLAQVEAPAWEDDEVTLDELRARINKTIAYVESLSADEINKSADLEISFPLPSGALQFTGESFLQSFAIPNFYFHVTQAYTLLRHAGVKLGKMDFLGAP